MNNIVFDYCFLFLINANPQKFSSSATTFGIRSAVELLHLPSGQLMEEQKSGGPFDSLQRREKVAQRLLARNCLIRQNIGLHFKAPIFRLKKSDFEEVRRHSHLTLADNLR